MALDEYSGRGGFLGRWSRRKTDVAQGRLLEEPLLPITSVPPAEGLLTEPVISEPVSTPAAELDTAETSRPALSLKDANALTRDSDFKPFMARGVGADVRNAAMKKLFSDPHFNVMDGLDTYIDDYSKSDPIPESMLRQMTSAKFLGLFAEEDKADAEAEAEAEAEKQDSDVLREDANDPGDESVAQCVEVVDVPSLDATCPDSSSQPSLLPPAIDVQARQEDHANTDLRLQPDHAAPAPGAGRGT